MDHWLQPYRSRGIDASEVVKFDHPECESSAAYAQQHGIASQPRCLCNLFMLPTVLQLAMHGPA